MKEGLYEITPMRQFARLTLSASIPEDTTIVKFRGGANGSLNWGCWD